MRPVLALICLLQIEQERSEEESSVGDALALAFRSIYFQLCVTEVWFHFDPKYFREVGQMLH